VQSIDLYEENDDRLMLEQFVIEHSQLVEKIALHIKRRLPSHIELEDLLQAGFVGLLEARKQFKPDMGASFETFSSIRIKGSIIDSLRKNSWGSRETLKNMRHMNEAISKVEQRHQRPATAEEIAAELGISMEVHLEICQQINIYNVISMDIVDADQSQIGNDVDDPLILNEKEDTLLYIKNVLTTFPEREQLVLSLYYIEEFTFKEIGEILELTEARICQIHGRAISKLQEKLQKCN